MKQIATSFLLLVVAIAAADGKTVISGNYDGEFVGIIPAMERDMSKIIRVPVVDGHFSYELNDSVPMVYSIQSDKNLWAYSINYFFSEPVELTVTFTPDIDSSGEDRGFLAEISAPEGSLSRRTTELHRKVCDLIDAHPLSRLNDSIEAVGAYYNPEFAAIMRLIRENPEAKTDSLRAVIDKFYETDTWRTPEATYASKRLNEWYASGEPDRIHRDVFASDTTLAGLFLTANMAWYSDDTYIWTESYEKHFKGRFPGHPYDRYLALIASSYDPVPGKPFIDFTAPDFNGTKHTLSELIKGKPAFLDLWSSNCAPCRRKSIEMKEIYDRYEPEGFTIVGVAREFGTSDGGKEAIKKDGYRWLNLLELDDANKIYARYRCANGLGSTYLIDDKGIIVAVNPTAAEVTAWLKDYYKK